MEVQNPFDALVWDAIGDHRNYERQVCRKYNCMLSDAICHELLKGYSFGDLTINRSIYKYTDAHMYLSTGFEYFAKSGFEWEPVMLEKQMIPQC